MPHTPRLLVRFARAGRHAVVSMVDRVNASVDVATVRQAIELAESTGDQTLWEQAAQAHNHAWFFRSMAPPGLRLNPSKALNRALRRDLGVKRRGLYAWSQAAASVFGSGWVWLCATPDGHLQIVTTKDAGLPPEGLQPLLVMDVWEHSYYLDYPTERKRYAEIWLGRLANWDLASAVYARVVGRG